MRSGQWARQSGIVSKLLAALLLLAAHGWVLGVSAQAADEPAAAAQAALDKTSSVGFDAAQDDVPKENLPAWPFLYGAYFAIWLLLLIYLGLMGFQNARLQGRIRALDARLDKLDRALEEIDNAERAPGGS